MKEESPTFERMRFLSLRRRPASWLRILGASTLPRISWIAFSGSSPAAWTQALKPASTRPPRRRVGVARVGGPPDSAAAMLCLASQSTVVLRQSFRRQTSQTLATPTGSLASRTYHSQHMVAQRLKEVGWIGGTDRRARRRMSGSGRSATGRPALYPRR